MKKSDSRNNVQNDALSDDALSLKAPLTNALDQQVDDLDLNVRSKLSAARHRALAGESSRQAHPGFAGNSWLLPAGLACTVALLGLLVVQVNRGSPTESGLQVAQGSSQESVQVSAEASDRQPIQELDQTPVLVVENSIMEDLHLLSASDDIEFYQSVEFLEWMEQNAG